MKEIIDEQLPSYKYKSTEQNGTSNSQEIENRQKTPDNILTDNKVDQDKEYYKEVTNQDSLLLREDSGLKILVIFCRDTAVFLTVLIQSSSV